MGSAMAPMAPLDPPLIVCSQKLILKMT